MGGGPIPVAVARKLSQDAFLKAVVHDGTEIKRVRHFGRHIPAELRTALDLGPMSFENLQPRCYSCHAEKTERDRRAGLLGGRAKARAP